MLSSERDAAPFPGVGARGFQGIVASMTDRSPPESFPAALDRTLRLSRFCARLAHARPDLVSGLEASAAAPVTRAQMQAEAAGDDEGLGRRLRELRQRVMFTLAHRDLNGLASLDEVLATMTALAEVAIGAASAEAHRATASAHGEPAGSPGSAPALIVAGLGKLGGGELNVSSDVDLVFLHGEAGDTPGPRPLAAEEFFAAAGRRLIATLSEVTADGQVFRVDMRLRPFGDAGPLVASLASLENYFIAQARPWERYAWLKARVLSGPGEALAAIVRPFVYRRYLDYGLLASLRELHARIFEAAVQRRKADDIKVGAGGIREIEFAVQLFQMVRGGRDRGLQTPSTRAALALVAERGLIEPARARALGEAYAFLRRLEHRLQYYDDQQTQSLPLEPEARAAIAESMGFADWGSLLAPLEAHRTAVAEAFNALFERPAAEAPASGLAAWLNDPQASPDPAGVAEMVARAGVAGAQAVAERLIATTRSRRYRALSATSRAKLDRLLGAVVEAGAREDGRAETVVRLLELLEAIDRRDAYLSLLIEYPPVLGRAARLAARSRWAARLLARHPILLDELTQSAASFTATDWAAERRSLAEECAAASGDVERLLDTLRHYKQRQVLRLAIADLEGELPVMALSDELSALADLILEVTVSEAAASQGLERALAGFAVVGYGKLGGKELGYGSDLDIVFLYDESRAADAERLARVVQRVNTWLTSATAAGVLYETDLRLRPDGAAGLAVSSIASFRDYQEKRAWTWEHQALTRARFCAGDPALGERFERLRDAILAAPRDREKLFAEIRAMRAKMRADKAHDARDLKHVAGGMVDLEFCVQAIVLAHGAAHPRLRLNKGNNQLLRWAGELGILEAEVAEAAAEAYLALRRAAHAAALNDEEAAFVAPGELEAQRAAVKRLWAAVFGEGAG